MSRPRKNAARYPAGERPCAWCGTVKRFKSGRRYCNRSCSALGLTVAVGDGEWQRRATKASQAAARNRRAEVLAKVAGLSPVDAFRYGYRLGQTAGYNSGRYRALRDAKLAALLGGVA